MNQKDKPLIQVKVETERDDDTVISLEVMDIYSESTVRVINKKENKDYTISMNVAMDLNPEEFNNASNKLSKEISNLRYQVNHPSKFANGVMRDSNQSRGFPEERTPYMIGGGRGFLIDYKVFVLEKNKDNNDQYIPYLRPTIMGYGDEASLQWQGECWVLFITGFDMKVFGCAKWDDTEGVKALTKSLNNDRELKITAGLTYPKESRVALALSASQEVLKKGKNNERAELTDILKNSLILDYFQPKGEHPNAYTKIGSFTLGGKDIAYKINVPNYPIFKEEEVKFSILEKYKEKRQEAKERKELAKLSELEIGIKKIEKINIRKSKWIEVFTKEAEAKGWRVCNPYSYEKGSLETLDTWLTKLSKKEWETLEPAFVKGESVYDTSQDFVF